MAQLIIAFLISLVSFVCQIPQSSVHVEWLEEGNNPKAYAEIHIGTNYVGYYFNAEVGDGAGFYAFNGEGKEALAQSDIPVDIAYNVVASTLCDIDNTGHITECVDTVEKAIQRALDRGIETTPMPILGEPVSACDCHTYLATITQ